MSQAVPCSPWSPRAVRTKGKGAQQLAFLLATRLVPEAVGGGQRFQVQTVTSDNLSEVFYEAVCFSIGLFSSDPLLLPTPAGLCFTGLKLADSGHLAAKVGPGVTNGLKSLKENAFLIQTWSRNWNCF